MNFNRLARPDEWSPLNGTLLHQHPLVTDETLAGQHPIRAWEYSQALEALETWTPPGPPLVPILIADIGGAGSNFWRTLRAYTVLPIYRIDPNHDWANPDDSSLYFRQTIGQFLQAREQEGPPLFDAVFCLSVIEHVPDDELDGFEHDLVSLVKPGGLLVLTCDAAPGAVDIYHFHWMRKRIYTPDMLAGLLPALKPLTSPDFTWHGPTVYDYGVASLVFVKEF